MVSWGQGPSKLPPHPPSSSLPPHPHPHPQDPFSCGAYSYIPVGGSKASYERMACPVAGVERVDTAIRENKAMRRVAHWEVGGG